MIRVNLLPVPKRRKREALIAQSILGLGIIFATAIGCYFVSMAKQSEITALNQKIQQKQRDIDELKAKVGEVEKFKKQAATLEQQLGVIRTLEQGRSGPVKVLDELTELVPRKLWIASLKEAGKKVTIEGVAESGPVIADFLDNLKASKHFENPSLSSVTGAEVEGTKAHKFVITTMVKYTL